TEALYLCSRPCEEPEILKEGKWIPLLVKGAGGAYLRISAESRMTWLSLPQEGNRKWGVSREHKSGITDLPQMLQEAWYSLWGEFSYSSRKNVGEIQFYLCENMREELSLGAVAEKFHFSEPYFCALFKKGTGMSVIHFVQHVRIHYGAYLIRSSGKKLQEIAEEVGFGNYSYFGKLFKRYVGQSPEAYRDSSEGNLGI
ncbi:MAG: helix-turn-helix domain-containing protein, partial [Clostridium sp.]